MTNNTSSIDDVGPPASSWVLFVASVTYFIVIMCVVVWIASPKHFRACCCRWRRKYRWLKKGASEFVKNARKGMLEAWNDGGDEDGEFGADDSEDEKEEEKKAEPEIEDWWSQELLDKNLKEQQQTGPLVDCSSTAKQEEETKKEEEAPSEH